MKLITIAKRMRRARRNNRLSRKHIAYHRHWMQYSKNLPVDYVTKHFEKFVAEIKSNSDKFLTSFEMRYTDQHGDLFVQNKCAAILDYVSIKKPRIIKTQ